MRTMHSGVARWAVVVLVVLRCEVLLERVVSVVVSVLLSLCMMVKSEDAVTCLCKSSIPEWRQ